MCSMPENYAATGNLVLATMEHVAHNSDGTRGDYSKLCWNGVKW